MGWKVGGPEARGQTEDWEPGTPDYVAWRESCAHRRKEEERLRSMGEEDAPVSLHSAAISDRHNRLNLGVALT